MLSRDHVRGLELAGSLASPGIFEVMEVLGRDETLGRLADAAESR